MKLTVRFTDERTGISFAYMGVTKIETYGDGLYVTCADKKYPVDTRFGKIEVIKEQDERG